MGKPGPLANSPAPGRPRRRVLLVEDDLVLQDILRRVLGRVYDVEVAADGLEAVQAFNRQPADLIVLDIIMPGMSGWTVCEQIRRLSDVPILILTSLDDAKDVVRGFQLGADDFLSKPFVVDVLLARIEAILRRVDRSARLAAPAAIQVGRLRLDVSQRQVWLDDHEVQLTPLEFSLLHYLVSRPGENISKERLFREVWGYHSISDSNLVEVGMRRLREKIEVDPSAPRMLLTVRGVGYRFHVPTQTEGV